MDRPRLTRKQAEAFRDRIRPMLHFLYRCRRRLDGLGFDDKGVIYRAVDKAYCAMHELHMALHYESCGHGVGRASHEQARVARPAEGPQPPPERPTEF
jgi:hypothetical protein